MPSPDPHILSLEAFPSSEAFSAAMELARGTGFDALLVPLGEGEDGAAIAPLAEQARAADIALYARLRVDLFAIDDPLVARHEDAFAIRRQGARDAKPIDPRSPAAPAGQALARLRAEDAHDILIPAIVDRLGDLIEAGLCGLIIDEPSTGSPAFWTRLLQQVRQRTDAVVFIAATPGLEREKARAIAASGFDYILSSVGWWDLRARWLVEEQQELRHAAPLMAEIGADTLRRHSDSAAALRLLNIAAATGAGMLVPLELIERLAEQGDACREALGLARDAQHFQGEMRLLSSPDAPATALLRMEDGDARESERALLLLINPSSEMAARLSEEEVLTPAGAFYQRFRRLSGSGPSFAPLAPGEIRALVGQHSKPVTRRIATNRKSARAAAEAPRIIVEQLRPSVAGGYPVKRVVGELLSVEADIYADGHEQLAAELLWRARDDRKWQAVRMTAGPNDVWTADMPLDRLGSHEYSVEAWLDRFGGFRRDFTKKRDAGVLQPVDYQEGRALVAAAHQRSAAKLRDRLARCLEEIDAAGEGDPQADALLSAELALLMDEADDRPFRTQATPVPVEAERLEARYSSWYELFPRSQVDDPQRHGTFDDVIRQLPRIRDMGFDTLYFPPIHPIGRKNMKGKNNSLDPAPDDVGSPYAIGSAEGGHDAIHPQLGSFEDFRRLIRAAHDHGLEIALDFAIQCSPDHPWLKEHPGWFDWRPDGTIKYAENPPKKYQDIVNVDFYTDASVPDLWIALRDIVLLWVREGVKVFRVDNPHTKPFPFWEWLIAEVRGQHPEVIFLAEAFTRPKIMYRLAKIGFSQSYTYFTWRNGKAELTDYLVELSTTAPREFFRPHFFVNTPDINPPYLQTSGRPGFQVRAVLAATLSGLFGVYSGFELCESAPLPGREEYLDSEKYEVRPRDYAAPGNIVADIALLNRLRRGHPALQTHLNTRFYNAWNDNILYYGKPSPGGGEMILVTVNLDPHHAQEADFEVPLWEFGLPDHGTVDVEDLATGDRFAWTGKGQHIRLDPSRPYRLWRITPAGGSVHG